MRPYARSMATALVVASAIVLGGCGSDTAATPSGTGNERNAAGGYRGVEVCVSGGYLLGWTVQFERVKTPPGNGPFRTQDNQCAQSLDGEFGLYTYVTAHLYRADGMEFAKVMAANENIGRPWTKVYCTDTDFPPQVGYSEGDSKTFDCASERVVVTRDVDTEDTKVFRLSVYPIR